MGEMGEVVYILCALTSLACAVLLGRAYLRTKARLLLWSTVCFSLLTINNVLLYVDLAIFPGPALDLRLWRGLTYLVAMAILVYGLIWDSE